MRSLLAIVSLGASLLGMTAHFAFAQASMSISVTPPLFQLNIAPGEVWKSSLKVVNSNAFPLTVYTQLYNFEPKGEDGQGELIPRAQGEGGAIGTLADWITITTDPIVIQPEQSADVPITVSIPKEAAPGGHFAAVLTGTRPSNKTGSSVVRTSQAVTSLFFVRVAGDIHESGTVREFSVAHTFQETPQADFSVRFQNTGNVHLQPQGDITIYNMWGKERGYIPINQRSHFGNVLPNSIRKFDFAWRGEASLADIGRYMAEVSLAYGESGRQTSTSKVYFWIIPFRATLVVLLLLFIFVSFIIWIVRRYVRRAMFLAGYEKPAKTAKVPSTHGARLGSKRALVLPLQEGVLDLRKRMKENEAHVSVLSVLFGYVRSYYIFFVGILGIIILLCMMAWYFTDVLQKQKKYQVTIQRGDGGVTLSQEEAARERTRAKEDTNNTNASTTQR